VKSQFLWIKHEENTTVVGNVHFFLTKTTALPTPEATKAVGGFFLTFGRYPKSTGCLGRSGMGMGTGGIIIGIARITYSHI
jgi:hypothetical protein